MVSPTSFAIVWSIFDLSIEMYVAAMLLLSGVIVCYDDFVCVLLGFLDVVAGALLYLKAERPCPRVEAALCIMF